MRTLISLLALLVLALSSLAADDAVGCGPVEPKVPVMAGCWKGRYFYSESSGMDSVPFRVRIRQDGDRITGRIVEPRSFGGDVPELKATLVGTVSADGSYRFTKTYDGTGGVSHDVVYEGKLSEGGGTWTVGWSGRFVLQRAAIGDAGAVDEF